MTYSQALDYINSFLVFGSKPGLGRITKLLNIMHNPQRKLKIVHVAGTNGKGSVCTYLTSVLSRCGYKVGTYLSPYISNFRERISICGEMIPEDDLAVLVTALKDSIEQMQGDITEFEVITAAAFKYFDDQKCDIVILETGMGGRFDATNIIEKPLVSVITSISYDHMQYLGDTLSQIAFEKCGIIKEEGNTVSYPLQNFDALEVIRKFAAEKENRLYIPDINKLTVIERTLEYTNIVYGNLNLRIPLKGDYQIYNCLTAIQTLEVLRELGYAVTAQNIEDGIAAAFIPARFEILSQNPLVIVDGAHNEDGVNALAQSMKPFIEGKKLVTVMGILQDKNYKKAISTIAEFSETMITVAPENPRALSADIAAGVASSHCAATPADSLKAGAETAVKLQKETPDSAILVCGSLYITGKMKEYLKNLLQ